MLFVVWGPKLGLASLSYRTVHVALCTCWLTRVHMWSSIWVEACNKLEQSTCSKVWQWELQPSPTSCTRGHWSLQKGSLCPVVYSSVHCALYPEPWVEEDFTLDFVLWEEMKADITVLLTMSPVCSAFQTQVIPFLVGGEETTLSHVCFTFVTSLWHFQVCNWAMAWL